MLSSLTREAMRTSALCSISSALAINGYLGPRRLSLYSTFASARQPQFRRPSPFSQEYCDAHRTLAIVVLQRSPTSNSPRAGGPRMLRDPPDQYLGGQATS